MLKTYLAVYFISLFLFNLVESSLQYGAASSKNILLVGGTRFSGLYLWKELHQRGHKVTLLNRGMTPLRKLPRESEHEFTSRLNMASFISVDRQDAKLLKVKLANRKFDVLYDMNGRELSDTLPLVEIFGDKLDHFVYMSSAGVYLKSAALPHREGDEEDERSRHIGKLKTERYLREKGVPFTAFRPSYIYGPENYNPLEEYFFSRIDANRPVWIPGHGEYVTGLGHVQDLAVAMANVIGKDHTKHQVYNIQDSQSISFQALARLAGQAMGKNPEDISVKFFVSDPVDLSGKKFFPFREQHFFCDVEKAMIDLDWKPSFSLLEGLQDSYANDFLLKKSQNLLKVDFSCDNILFNCSLAK